jgi:hypothetical protein
MTELERLKKKQEALKAKLEMVESKEFLKEIMANVMAEISAQVSAAIDENCPKQDDLDSLMGRYVRQPFEIAADRYARALYAVRTANKEAAANE